MISWFFLLSIAILVLLIPTAYAGFIGAPYVPVRRPALQKAFDRLKISSHDTVVDLGAGDGGVVQEAARRGAKALGFELSPIMWAIGWIHLTFFTPSPATGGDSPLVRGRKPQIFLRNFYNQPLPIETTIVFAFLMPKNLPRLVAYLKKQSVPQAQYLLSYTFALPNLPPADIVQTPAHGTVYIYRWSQLSGQKS
jgi:hypothetical protein